MPRSNRLSLSLASTAAVALASLPLGITPASAANAAKVSEGTTSSIGVVAESSNASQFNLGKLEVQGSTTDSVASRGGNGGNAGLFGVRGSLQGFLQQLLNYLFGVPGAGWTPGMPGMKPLTK